MQAEDNSLGFLEAEGLVAVVEAADAMLKSASVRLFFYQKVGAGLIALGVMGELGSVKTALEAGELAARRHGEVISLVLSNPSPQVKAALGL